MVDNISLTETHAYLGVGAGAAVTTGQYNVLVGPYAAYKLTTGQENTVVGYTALGSATTADKCTAVGWRAGNNAKVSVTQLSVFGYRAGYNMAGGGDYSTAIGAYALEQAAGESNTAVGAESGKSITTGSANTFLGRRAGRHVSQKTDAVGSIAIGVEAYNTADYQAVFGPSNITETILRGRILVGTARGFVFWPAQENFFMAGGGPSAQPSSAGHTAAGFNALGALTTGQACTAFGARALESLTTGADHAAFGAGALQKQTTGVGCSAFGRLSLANSTTGTNNTGFGDTTLEHLIDGDGNSALGYGALRSNTDGSYNCAFGLHAAGYYLDDPDERTHFSYNCAFGNETLHLNRTGDYNCAFGHQALHNALGGENVAVGTEALKSLFTGGTGNTAVGHHSGISLTDGATTNTFVGHGAGKNASQKIDAVNSMALGAGAFTTKDNQAVVGNGSVTETVLRGVQVGTVLTVATLPAATGLAGTRSFVSDSTVGAAGNFGAVVVGGGAITVPVWCDGTDWLIG